MPVQITQYSLMQGLFHSRVDPCLSVRGKPDAAACVSTCIEAIEFRYRLNFLVSRIAIRLSLECQVAQKETFL